MKKSNFKTYQNYLKYLNAEISNFLQSGQKSSQNHSVTNRMSGMFKFRITKKAHVTFFNIIIYSNIKKEW